MEIVRRINDELAIAEAFTFEQWQQIAEEGFQSVLNLRTTSSRQVRSLDMPFLNTERQYAESLGLRYVSLPIDIDIEVMSVEIALRVLKQIDELPKPTLIYNNATLAAAIVLMYIAMRQGETLQQAIQRTEKLGLFRVSIQPLATSSVI